MPLSFLVAFFYSQSVFSIFSVFFCAQDELSTKSLFSRRWKENQLVSLPDLKLDIMERVFSLIFLWHASFPSSGFFYLLIRCVLLLIDYRMSGLDGKIAVQIQPDSVLRDEIVRQQLTLALDEDETTLLETESKRLQNLTGLVCDLELNIHIYVY